MKITEKNLDFLRSEIKKYVSGKRLAHTLSVEKEAAKLGSIFSLSKDKINKLAAAGILHDITKSLGTEEQIELMKKYNISLTQDDLQSPKIFHSITGAHFAREHFPEFTDREIFLSILYHTTGKPSMTLFQKLIYLADYIEPLRDFPDCVRLRDFFYSVPNINVSHLDKTLLLSFDLTISNLVEEKQFIHKKTVAARNYLLLK